MLTLGPTKSEIITRLQALVVVVDWLNKSVSENSYEATMF